MIRPAASLLVVVICANKIKYVGKQAPSLRPFFLLGVSDILLDSCEKPRRSVISINSLCGARVEYNNYVCAPEDISPESQFPVPAALCLFVAFCCLARGSRTESVSCVLRTGSISHYPRRRVIFR